MPLFRELTEEKI